LRRQKLELRQRQTMDASLAQCDQPDRLDARPAGREKTLLAWLPQRLLRITHCLRALGSVRPLHDHLVILRSHVCEAYYGTLFQRRSWFMNGSQRWNKKKPLGIVTLAFGCSMTSLHSPFSWTVALENWNQKSHSHVQNFLGSWLSMFSVMASLNSRTPTLRYRVVFFIPSLASSTRKRSTYIYICVYIILLYIYIYMYMCVHVTILLYFCNVQCLSVH